MINDLYIHDLYNRWATRSATLRTDISLRNRNQIPLTSAIIRTHYDARVKLWNTHTGEESYNGTTSESCDNCMQICCQMYCFHCRWTASSNVVPGVRYIPFNWESLWVNVHLRTVLVSASFAEASTSRRSSMPRNRAYAAVLIRLWLVRDCERVGFVLRRQSRARQSRRGR